MSSFYQNPGFRYIRIFLLFCSLLTLPSTSLGAPAIYADNKYFDISSGLYILQGNVSVETGTRIITAGLAKVNMISMEVWASEGITFSQPGISFSGDTAYIHGSAHEADITGPLQFVQEQNIITASHVIFNWQTKLATFSGNVMATTNEGSYSADSIIYNVETRQIQ